MSFVSFSIHILIKTSTYALRPKLTVFLTLSICPWKYGYFYRHKICGSFFLSLSCRHKKVIKWQLFCSKRYIGWEDHHLSRMWQWFHTNSDVFTLKTWRLESKRTTARGKRSHEFRAPISPKQKKYRINLGFIVLWIFNFEQDTNSIVYSIHVFFYPFLQVLHSIWYTQWVARICWQGVAGTE